MTSPLTLHAAPAAGFDEPFEMLVACHGRVRHMLALLQRLAAHLAQTGCDEQARQAARDVMRYFDLAGPAHHEDEERHLFPALRATGDAALAALVARLQQEHLAMAGLWAEVRGDLLRVAAGGAPDVAGIPGAQSQSQARWAAFAALYDGHIEAEEDLAYPAAQALLDAATTAAMGREMAQRRGAA